MNLHGKWTQRRKKKEERTVSTSIYINREWDPAHKENSRTVGEKEGEKRIRRT